MNRSRLVCALAAGLFSFLAAGRGQPAYNGPNHIRSGSGQFLVSFTPNNSPFYRRPEGATNTDLLRLEPSLLAISADHFKTALWQALGLSGETAWRGKIFLALHPARSTDETVVIASEPFLETWNYRLELPDLIRRNRYARALSAVLLMEFANRRIPATAQPAEVPPWLVDGLARQVIETDATQAVLSAPTKRVDAVTVTQFGLANIPDGLKLTRVNLDRRGLDPLAAARRVLQNQQALTFDQLSWPAAAQEEGRDGGTYLASAQLFVHELLDLHNGPARLREMLAQLPRCRNWQTAFYAAFRDQFRSPLAVEKWWALRVVAFAARDPGPQWTVAVSRRKFEAALAVPVDIRSASNALPRHAEVSLQAALRSFEPPRQTEIIEMTRRNLDLIQLRLANPLAPLGDAYRNALGEFLDRQKNTTASRFRRNDAVRLIAQLDELDQRRQKLDTALERAALPVRGPD